jgi:hypothetical protein
LFAQGGGFFALAEGFEEEFVAGTHFAGEAGAVAG